MNARPWRTRLAAMVFALGAALGLWAFWLEPAGLRVAEHRLELPGWPEACGGLRIAVLADLHVGSPWNGLGKLERIVDATRATTPDLVLAPGDFVIQGVLGGRFVAPDAAARVLATTGAPLGTFGVLGNHDHWFDAARVATALDAAGVPTLEDRATTLTSGACSFSLVGVSDLWEGRHDLDGALADAAPDLPRIVFTHNPDLFPRMPADVVLTIAGHTHGGQVYLPGIGRPIVPSRFGERYAIGHVVEDGRHLFVSPGLGTSILPVRFLVPPEITVLVLDPA